MSLGPLMLDLAGTTVGPEDRALLQSPVIGGVILFARNFESREQVSELVREIHAVRAAGSHTAPLLLAVDQEGGRVQRFKTGFSKLPPLRWLGRLYDESPSNARHLAVIAARIMANEVLDTGVDFSFAPCVDLDWGCCDVIGDRALHQKPEVVAELGLAYSQGMQQAGMAAVAKHFPGHGGVTGDSHHVLPEDGRSFSELGDDMRPYATLAQAGLQGVMMAHIRYTELDSQIASLSAYWMQTVLREQLGFNGAIFSDDLSMKGASVGGTAGERSLLALQAGADMILICNDRPAAELAVEALAGYDNPVAHARLAAMRLNPAASHRTAFGSAERQRDLDALQTALTAPPPPLELDGNS